jgi:hypothetical protein
MPRPLGSTARGVVLAGALGSLACTLRAGRNAPRLLLIAIAIWVLVPFVVVFLVDAVSRRWSATSQSALHALMVLLAVLSLAVYGAELVRPHTPPAFMFVLVPPASLLLMACVFAAATVVTHRQLRKG